MSSKKLEISYDFFGTKYDKKDGESLTFFWTKYDRMSKKDRKSLTFFAQKNFKKRALFITLASL